MYVYMCIHVFVYTHVYRLFVRRLSSQSSMPPRVPTEAKRKVTAFLSGERSAADPGYVVGMLSEIKDQGGPTQRVHVLVWYMPEP